MRRNNRHSRVKYRKIAPWPANIDVAEVASGARYVGSGEHKGHHAPGFSPALRKDATECPPELSKDLQANTEFLRMAILAGCVGHQFEDGFPKYVWGWIGDQLFEARHMRGPVGTYKAFPLELPLEMPEDPEGRLAGPQWN